MKPSTPMLLSFLLPLTLAATAHAQEPSAATPQGFSPAAAPVAAPAAPPPAQPAPVLAAAPPTTALPAPPPPLMVRRSEGLRIAGIVMIPLGAVALGAGSFVAVASSFGGGTVESGGEFGAPVRESSGPSSTAVVGLTFMGVGALTLTGGIIMAAVGGKKIPAPTTEGLAPAPRWAVEPLVGAGTAGVKVRF